MGNVIANDIWSFSERAKMHGLFGAILLNLASPSRTLKQILPPTTITSDLESSAWLAKKEVLFGWVGRHVRYEPESGIVQGHEHEKVEKGFLSPGLRSSPQGGA